MQIKVLLVNEQGAQFTTIENSNKDINELLGWDDAWNTPSLSIRGKKYIAICSDTGKLKHEKVSALSYINLIEPKEAIREPFLVGSIIITKFDGTDDFESLNDKDEELLKSRIFTHGKPYMKDFNPTILILD